MGMHQNKPDADLSVVNQSQCPVLILNYNGWDDTIACITAMQSHIDNIWLIDNASPVNRLAEVKGRFPSVRQLVMPDNLGWAGAYNRAIAVAASEGHNAVYLLNNDAVARPGAVEAALTTLRGSEDIAAVGSMMLDNGGTRAFFDGDWHWDRTMAAASLRDDVREVRSLHGGGFAIKLLAYDTIGPFFEGYFLYHEETDWCLRASTAGWRIMVDCASRVDHEGEGSSVGSSRLYYIARNRFLAKRRGIHLRDREETNFSIVEYEFFEAAGHNFAARVAITEGLIDGLRGRFGRRFDIRIPRMITVPLAATMPFLIRLKRKVSHVLKSRA